MSNIDLITTDTESLQSLAARQQEGFSVMRSAHVGNARAYNLAFASMGIDMLLVDHTITGVDENYRPESIIQDANERQVAALGHVSFRTLAWTADGNTYLDELHANSLRQAFPETLIQTNSEYIRKNDALAGEIAKIAASAVPDIFRRVVHADEPFTVEDPAGARRMAANGEILQLKDEPRRERGVLLPNEVDILTGFVIELIASGRDTQYHVSGPDMVNYMARPKSRDDKRKPLDIINTIYAELYSRSSFRAQLPETFTVKLVPGTPARFATTTERADDLDGLLAQREVTERRLAELRKDRATFFGSPSSKDESIKQPFIRSSNAAKAETAMSLKRFADRCADMFVGPKEAPYVSQYDVLAEAGLYIPASIQSMSMAELTGLANDIQNLQKGAT